MVHDDKTAIARRNLLGRQFVILPRRPDQIPDEPLRQPNHYCYDCGAMRIRCWQCEGTVRWPILEVREGYHIGRCEEHGALVMVCPCKRSLTAEDHAALTSQPVEPLRLTHQREPAPSIDTVEHERKREHVAVAVGVMVGFVIGVMLTLVTVWAIAAAR